MRVEHLMYAKDFKLLKARLSNIDENTIDSEILEFIVNANCSDQLVSIWSCQGHQDDDSGYVMFGVRNLAHIYKLYELITWEFKDNQHLVGLTMTTRQNFVAPPNKRTGKQGWYAVWNLYWKSNEEVSRQQGWEFITKASRNFQNWLEEQAAFKLSYKG